MTPGVYFIRMLKPTFHILLSGCFSLLFPKNVIDCVHYEGQSVKFFFVVVMASL